MEGVSTLIGGVGYHDLQDFSVGPIVAGRLATEPWPATVTVEDLSYGPVAVLHRLEEAEPPFERMIVIGSVRRGRVAGTVSGYRWDGALPDVESIQARVAEAVTAVVGVENLVVVVAALGSAPKEVFVIEVEPWIEGPGQSLSPPVARAADEVARLVREIALAPRGSEPVPRGPLGGSRLGSRR